MKVFFNVFVSACLLLAIVGRASTNPVFNIVNSNYANGTACPAITKDNIACPLLCVKNPVTQCPLAVAATCTGGLQFCGDGACHASCDGIANICMCGHSASELIEVLSPCKAGQLVNISNYNLAEKDAQTRQVCSSTLGLSNVSQWTDVLAGTVPANGSPVWQSCDPPPATNFTYREPMWIAIWSVYFGFYALTGLWVLYKRFREKDVSSPLALDDDPSELNEKTPTHSEAADFIVNGYNNDPYGSFMILYIFGVSFGFFAFLMVEVLDYYGLVTGNFYGVFLDSYPLSSKVFCGTWFFATSWLLAINLTKSRIRNFYRIRVLPEYAQVVQIEKKREVVVLLDDHSPFLARIRHVEDTIREALGFDYIVSTSPILLSSQGYRYFEFQCARYVYNQETHRFEPFKYNLGTEHQSLLKQQHGLTSEEASNRLEMIGPNFVQVKVPNFAWAMWQELTGFFYLYQSMILWLFYYDAYWQIGISDTGVIILAALVKVIIRLRGEHRVKKMAEHEDTCTVLRNGSWVQMSTANLVPGDVFEVQEKVVPVDGIILSGDIIVDESSLTGEPLPIRKFPIKDDAQSYDRNTSGKIATLFAGTKVVQSVGASGQKPIALVTETGANTDKGRLIHKILFPHAVSFIFHEQLKFVFILLLCWGFILMGFGIWWLGGSGMAAWFYGMFCISQVMSPILPAILVVGQSVAASSLRKKGIFCVDLNRIMMAGKVQIFCFDKTGTLTKEGLEFYGAQPVAAREADDDEAKKTAFFEDHVESFAALNSILRMGIATCHSVAILDDQYIGNPVDIEMFRSTKWELAPTADAGYVDTLHPKDDPNSTASIHIVKRWEFQHARASMSVAVLDTSTNHVHIFVKGSFEKIKEISEAESIPANFDSIATELAKEGCYVLGMAHSDLGEVDLDTVRGWTRDRLESNVFFVGLVLFKNMLKHDTAKAIYELKEGNTRTVMITGDNALTGIYIARACTMLPESNRVLLGDLVEGAVVWTDVDNGQRVDIDAVLADKGLKPVELAVTGKAFNRLAESNLMRKYLLDTRVFARMTPTDKIKCVELHMERGVTAMCGDGGNDCGALRAAQAGIAMSEAEASIVSPFSTSQRTVMSCVELLIQGRAALATSFAGYKYLIMYGETMATLKLLTFYFSISPSENTWILVDAFITVGLSFAVTQALANKKLSRHRPTSRILGPETLASVLGLLFINAWFLIGSFIWLYQQEWFRCQEFDARNTDPAKWWLLGDNFETDVLSFVTLFQFVNSASVFNFGYVFRQPWYRNYLLVFIWAVFIVIVSYWELADPNAFGCMFRLNCGDPDVLVALGYPRPTWTQEPYNITQGHNVLPRDFRYKLWVYSICNMIAGTAWEYFVVLGPVRNWLRKKYPLPRQHLKL